MNRHITSAVLGVAMIGLAASVVPATPAGATATPATDSASCMGSGASFYGTFATRQMAFVAEYVVALDGAPGETFSVFGQEKEGGSIPTPCGTSLE